jgi:hypothetical protein
MCSKSDPNRQTGSDPLLGSMVMKAASVIMRNWKYSGLERFEPGAIQSTATRNPPSPQHGATDRYIVLNLSSLLIHSSRIYSSRSYHMHSQCRGCRAASGCALRAWRDSWVSRARRARPGPQPAPGTGLLRRASAVAEDSDPACGAGAAVVGGRWRAVEPAEDGR